MLKKLLFIVLMIFSSMVYAQSSSNQPLTVVLDWVLNPDHAPLLVAEQQGYFQQQGLDVKLIQPSDPSDGPKLVAAKKADIAVTYQPQLLMQVDQGLPLVRFGSLVDSPLGCLVTLQWRSIHSLEDLKGKPIGYSAGGIDQVMLETMLHQHGMNINDVTFINVRYDLVQALISGNILAFTGGMRNVEPIELEEAGYPVRVFYPEQNGFPTYEELIFVANRDKIDDPRLAKFLAALQKGVDYLAAHPQESWAAVIKLHPELNNPVNKASWLATIHYFSKNPAALDKAKYQAFAQFLQQQGVIKKVPDLQTYTVVK